jgi:lipoprotein-anchoring transpeptidase ErfK/SrfK
VLNGRRLSLVAVVIGALACNSKEPAKQTAPSAVASVNLFGGFERARKSMPAPSSTTTAPMGGGTGLRSVPAAAPVVSDGVPRLAATTLATLVYREPDLESSRLGYIRVGGIVERSPSPVPGRGCKGPWYAVKPAGFVCSDFATVDVNEPLVRAASRRADLSRPLPYHYGFVRATAPQYLRIPTYKEQLSSEMELEEHLTWYEQNEASVQRVSLGANDVPLDERGMAKIGGSLPAKQLLSSQLDSTQLLGGEVDPGVIPFWLTGGRAIPNISGFEVPSYAVFADRVRRKTGLSFVDAFVAEDEGKSRRFGVTVDLRLVPATKVKPDTGSAFHGMEITDTTPLPFAFVAISGVNTYRLIRDRDEARPDEAVPRRAVVPLSGAARIKAGARYYQVARDPKRWLRAADIGVVALPPTWPEAAEKGQKWIDISLVQQTLVLYQGKKPVYATLISSGQDRLGDPKTQKATIRGTFRIQSKHVAAAMDSEENSSVAGGQKSERHLSLDDEARATIERLTEADKKGTKLSDEDKRRLLNIKKGRHPEYGVTRRRGSSDFELRDVPWIQYFAAGFALHGAYWHDVFGIPRSHGCVNLAPIDARYVFLWTDPPLPDGWHGFNAGAALGEGTTVVVRE